MEKYQVSERRGTLAGCPRDLWVISIPELWKEEEIEVVEATLRARLQEHYDHFQEWSGLGIWRLSVSYNHTRFFAKNLGHGYSNELEARTAREKAYAITQDYAALRRYWEPDKVSSKMD